MNISEQIKKTNFTLLSPLINHEYPIKIEEHTVIYWLINEIICFFTECIAKIEVFSYYRSVFVIECFGYFPCFWKNYNQTKKYSNLIEKIIVEQLRRVICVDPLPINQNHFNLSMCFHPRVRWFRVKWSASDDLNCQSLKSIIWILSLFSPFFVFRFFLFFYQGSLPREPFTFRFVSSERFFFSFIWKYLKRWTIDVSPNITSLFWHSTK